MHFFNLASIDRFTLESVIFEFRGRARLDRFQQKLSIEITQRFKHEQCVEVLSDCSESLKD